jgi:hypothetical protein
MICPVCGGRREVTRRFLVFFTVRRPCPRCAPYGRDDRDDRWTDDSWRRTDDSVRLSAVALPLSGRDNDQFEVGGEGKSGGAGGGASWTDDAPVIVDPFAADPALPAEQDAGSDFSATESQSADSTEGSSESDSGTAY